MKLCSKCKIEKHLAHSRDRGSIPRGSTMKSTTVIAICYIMLGLAVMTISTAAAFLAYHNRSGWGWFVFLAFLGLIALCSVNIEFKGNNEQNTNK